MKSIKSKALFFGLSLFAFTAIQAQTTDTTKTDTTKHSTVMVNLNRLNSENSAVLTSSFVMINDNKLAAKLEAIDSKKVI
ncbi:MAG TPA: hypothetical protein VIJ75_09570 [Hanamia sp.]